VINKEANNQVPNVFTAAFDRENGAVILTASTPEAHAWFMGLEGAFADMEEAEDLGDNKIKLTVTCVVKLLMFSIEGVEHVAVNTNVAYWAGIEAYRAATRVTDEAHEKGLDAELVVMTAADMAGYENPDLVEGLYVYIIADDDTEAAMVGAGLTMAGITAGGINGKENVVVASFPRGMEAPKRKSIQELMNELMGALLGGSEGEDLTDAMLAHLGGSDVEALLRKEDEDHS
jgi:hypothetical protein